MIAFFAPPEDEAFFAAPDAREACFCAAVRCGALVFCARLASNLPFFLIGMTSCLYQNREAREGLDYGNNIISERP